MTDLLQQAEDLKALYKKVGKLISEKGFARFIGIGEDIKMIKDALPGHIKTAFFPNTESFLTTMPHLQFQDELVLVKGARRFALERITKRLSKQKHKTVLEINLGAMARNLNDLKHK